MSQNADQDDGLNTSVTLPEPFESWFRSRGWKPFDHQLKIIEVTGKGRGCLLIAPTGAGKTLSGFLPSLIQISQDTSISESNSLFTLYISPLKALAADIQRNVQIPIDEMGLPIRCEIRTGDTPAHKRQKQRQKPPNILMTTPESLALMLSFKDGHTFFKNLNYVILDELHALAGTRRGELLSLNLARLKTIAENCRFIGLSATIADTDSIKRYLFNDINVIRAKDKVMPEISILRTRQHLPWSGHMATYAAEEIYNLIKNHRHSIIFVNTRAQAEIIFQTLWHLNNDNLKISLHHGSLAAEQRKKVENAMASGRLDAVVATSSLDLGIDWGEVDLVIQIGAPKGASRLLQRIGRANHRMDEPSKAVLVPANRFEVMECQAAIESIKHGWLDGETDSEGSLDILAQHILGMACAGPLDPEALYSEVIQAAPYRNLERADFDKALEFVRNGGYSLKSYDQYQKLIETEDGNLEIAHNRFARQYRMNVGTIVEDSQYTIQFKRGRKLGQVEEYFILGLTPGDNFVFSGQILKFDGIEKNKVIVSKAKPGEDPKVPAYAGGRLPLTTSLADHIRAMLGSPLTWEGLPAPVREWLEIQKERSVLPPMDGLLVETFTRNRRPRAARNKNRPTHYLVAYCFEGRNAHQTLGMLLTRRMERFGYNPLGFVANDYVIAVWSLNPVKDVEALFVPDIMGDDLEEWMEESAMLKRTFRHVAIVAGLIDRRHPGTEKTGRQILFNSDLIFDVLKKYEPDHILLKATRQLAARGLTDIRRLSGFLTRFEGKIRHVQLDRASPLAVPVLLEVGREPVWQQSGAYTTLIEDIEAEAEAVVKEATGI